LDLTPDLIARGTEAVAILADMVRLVLYQARIDDAFSLLDVDVLARVLTDLAPAESARLTLARAQAMQVHTMLTRTGHEDALALVDEVLRTAEALGDRRLLADARCLESWLRINLELGRGNPSDPVLVPIEACLELRRELEDRRGVAEALFLRGLAQERVAGATEADVDRAMDTYRESDRLAEVVGDLRIRSYNAYHIGTIHGRREHLDEALASVKAAYDFRSAIGMKVFLPGPCLTVGRTYWAMGDLDSTHLYCEETLRLSEEIGHHAFRFFSLIGLGDVAKARGEISEARSLFERATGVAGELGNASLAGRAAEAIRELGR